MSKKFTPWFPGDVKPVRKGVYQQISGIGREVGYQYWDGYFWFAWDEEKAGALREYKHGYRACTQNDKWRGLTEEAK